MRSADPGLASLAKRQKRAYESGSTMMKNGMVALLLAAVVVSCVSTSTTIVAPSAKRVRINPEEVVLYDAPDKVPGKYDEMAILFSESALPLSPDKLFYDSFRKEAAKIGANGLILFPTDNPPPVEAVGGTVLGIAGIPTAMGRARAVAKAIYVHPINEKLLALETTVHAGMTRDAMIEAVGQPMKSNISVDGAGHTTEKAVYTANTGVMYLVTLRNGVVETIAVVPPAR